MGLIDRVLIEAVEVGAKTPVGKAVIAAAEQGIKEVFAKTTNPEAAHQLLGKLANAAANTADAHLPPVSIGDLARSALEQTAAKTFGLAETVKAPIAPGVTATPVYKVLIDGRSPYLADGRTFPLPKKTATGWEPGEWIEHTTDTKMAEIVKTRIAREGSALVPGSQDTAGIYVSSDPAAWISPAIDANRGLGIAPTVYEVELDAGSAKTFNEALKGLNNRSTQDFAAERIRLLRPIENGPNSPLDIIKRNIESQSSVLSDMGHSLSPGAVEQMNARIEELYKVQRILEPPKPRAPMSLRNFQRLD